MTEEEVLRLLADQYAKDGYTVVLRPSGPDTPAFLDLPAADLLATKGDQVLAVQLKKSDPSRDQPFIAISSRADTNYSLSLAAEAERLQTPETVRAALLISWAAFEAAAREVLEDPQKDTSKPTLQTLLRALLDRKLIDVSEFERLREAMYLRNLVVHGLRPDDLPSDLVTFLLGIVRKIKRGQVSDTINIRDGISVTIINNTIAQNQARIKLVERANGILNEVLGDSQRSVSVEWGQAEDGQGRPVMVLKISDFMGTVTATFAPDELEKPAQFATRLYRLWGDLLKIRTMKQLEILVGKRLGA